MLTTFNEVDMSGIMKLRSERKEKFMQKHDIKLGFMSFFTKAVIGALKDFPLLNAEIQGNELVLKKFYDIGIAVSTEEGLVVPVVRDADKMDFAGVESEIANLAKKPLIKSCHWMNCRAEHSRSPMAEHLVRCCRHQSLIHHRLVFLACIISKNVQWLCRMIPLKSVQ